MDDDIAANCRNPERTSPHRAVWRGRAWVLLRVAYILAGDIERRQDGVTERDLEPFGES